MSGACTHEGIGLPGCTICDPRAIPLPPPISDVERAELAADAAAADLLSRHARIRSTVIEHTATQLIIAWRQKRPNAELDQLIRALDSALAL